MTFSTPPVSGKNTFYVDNSGTWELFDDYDYFEVRKKQNQLSEFEVKIFDISTAQKAYFKENAKVLFFVGTKLLLKGRIQKIEYGSAFEVIARGYSMGVLLADDVFIKDGDNRVQYTNTSAQSISNDILSENSDGNSPFIISSSKKGLFNSDYGNLSMRFEHANRLNSIGEVSKAIDGEWWVEQYPSDDYNTDYFYLDTTRGSVEDNQLVGTSTPINFSSTITRVGQRRYLYGAISKIQFNLDKVGSPTGDVTFAIRRVSDDSIIASKVLGDASTISGGGFNSYEATLDSVTEVNEEVYITCEHSGDASNYIIIESDSGMNLPVESAYTYNGSYSDSGNDLVYKLTFGSRRTFDITTNATKTSQDRDFTNLANKVTVLGYGDGDNQLKTTTYSGSVTHSQLAADITSTDTTITLLDATGLSNGDHIRIAEEEIEIGTVSGNTLSGCTRGINNTTAKEHKKNVYVEKSSDKYEFYNTVDSSVGVYGNNWKSQTFTVGTVGTNETFTLTKCRLYLRKIGNPTGPFKVSVRAVDGTGKPTGQDLSVGTIKTKDISTSSSLQIYSIEMSDVDLSASTQYAIVVRTENSDSSNYIRLGFHDNSGTYTGGERLISSDGGSSWTAQSGDDVAFELWGFTAGTEDNASIRKYGKKSHVEVNRNIINEPLAELVASKILLDRMTPIIRIKLTPDEPMTDSILNIGDIITINDTEADISGDFRIIGINYKSNYGLLTLEIEVSNRSLEFIEQMKKQREAEQNLSKYMQGSTNIFSVQETENAESGAPIDVFFNIPEDAIAINKISLSYRNMKPRTYAQTVAGGGGQTTSSGGGTTETTENDEHGITISSSSSSTYTTLGPGPGYYTPTATEISTSTKYPVGFVWMAFESVNTTQFIIRPEIQVYDGSSWVTVSGTPSHEYNLIGGDQHHIAEWLPLDFTGIGSITKYRVRFYISRISGITLSLIDRGHGMVLHEGHTHDITIPNHTHTVSDHTHNITYDINEQTYTTTDISIWTTDDASGTPTWTDRTAEIENALNSTLTATDEGVENDIDLTEFFSGTGWKGIRLSTNGNSRHQVQVNVKVFIESK